MFIWRDNKSAGHVRSIVSWSQVARIFVGWPCSTCTVWEKVRAAILWTISSSLCWIPCENVVRKALQVKSSDNSSLNIIKLCLRSPPSLWPTIAGERRVAFTLGVMICVTFWLFFYSWRYPFDSKASPLTWFPSKIKCLIKARHFLDRAGRATMMNMSTTLLRHLMLWFPDVA